MALNLLIGLLKTHSGLELVPSPLSDDITTAPSGTVLSFKRHHLSTKQFSLNNSVFIIIFKFRN